MMPEKPDTISKAASSHPSPMPFWRKGEVAGIGGAILVISLLHFSLNVGRPELHVYHVVLRTLYLIPIFAASIWFGLRGSLIISIVVSVTYGLHIVTGWQGYEMENANQVAMVSVYFAVGVVSGILSNLAKRQRDARLQAERRTQREAVINSLEGLSRALKWRDAHTQRHSEAVVDLSLAIGRRLGVDPQQLESLRLAARVHDIGKIGIRDDILLKPDGLSPEERETIHAHPRIAADILRPVAGASGIAEIVLCHHERPDGKGYPRGLRKSEIPVEALILSVADTYCALMEDRPYRAGLTQEEALWTLNDLCGTALDRRPVNALKEILQDSTSEEPAIGNGLHQPGTDSSKHGPAAIMRTPLHERQTRGVSDARSESIPQNA